MEEEKEPLSGYIWQFMGSNIPQWQEGYDLVSAWFVHHARGEGHWDALLTGAHEAMKFFKGESDRQLDYNLRLNTGLSEIRIIHEKKQSAAFMGHEGRILLVEEGKSDVLAERPFFVVMDGEKVITVALRAQIL